MGWFLGEVATGLKELERIRRSLDAATALLIAAMPQTRDTTAAIIRATGVSRKESHSRQAVAKVVSKVPGALDALKTGKVSAEHLAALSVVADRPGAAALLAEAGSKSPEVLGREALQLKLTMECGNDVVKRQHAQRFVRFSDGPDGMIAINGLFPPLEGTDLKTGLAAVVDARYRAAHPDRAATLGGHGEDTRDQRTADALLEVCGVRSHGKPPQSSPDRATPDTASTSSETSPKTSTETPLGPLFDEEATHSPTESSNEQALRKRPAETGSHEEQTTDRPCTCECKRHQYFSYRNNNNNDARPATGPPEASPGIDVRTSKPAHIITFNVENWEARLAGGPPVPISGNLFDQINNDLYLCYLNMESEPLKFGRARRYPTAIQRLAITARDQHCIYPGCHNPPQHCNIHHLEEVHLDQGPTDVNRLGLLCPPHPQHIHQNNETISRNPDTTHTIRNRNTGQIVAHG